VVGRQSRTILRADHGRFYLDEMFGNVRVTQNASAYLIGGEPSAALSSVVRTANIIYRAGTPLRCSGSTAWTQLPARGPDPERSATNRLLRGAGRTGGEDRARVRSPNQPRFVKVARGQTAGAGFSSMAGAAPVVWGEPRPPFPYARSGRCGKADRLYLAYHVERSVAVAQSRDRPTQLFRRAMAWTSSSRRTRKPAGSRGPVPGDRRLLIAPHGDGAIAMLYCFANPGAAASR